MTGTRTRTAVVVGGGPGGLMAAEVMAARQLTLYAAREKDAGRRCDLEAGMAKLLGARVAWAAADNALQIHGGNGFALAAEDACRSDFAINPIGINNTRIDRRTFDDRSFRSEVAHGKGYRAGQTATAGNIGRHDDIVGVDAVVGHRGETVTLDPAAAADRILDALRDWGYLE